MRTSLKIFALVGLAAAVGLGVACSANGDDVFSTGGAGGAGGQGGAGPGPGGGNTTGDGGDLNLGGNNSNSSGTGMTTCDSGPNDDADMDGFTPATGDCNDCDAAVNPNAVEVPTPMGTGGGGGGGGSPEPADEDCDGEIDEAQEICDTGLNVADEDPLNAARAVELCKMSNGTDWGVVSAAWVMADGSPPPAGDLADFHRGHGLLSGFGPNVTVRAGERMLAVSSGTGRQPTDVGYASPGGFSKGYAGQHPQGFPKESPACPGTITGTPFDPTAVEITIRTPSNALGFSFNFNFYTYEWPVYICSQYNDFFVAILAPIPQGQTDGQISFDNMGNPVSVNNAFVDVCGCSNGPPCVAGGKTFACSLGTTELTGTGFEGHAATSWLKTEAPIAPNAEITIRWGAYDSGDGILDSTGLVDNWQWIAEPGTTVGTTPDPPDPPE